MKQHRTAKDLLETLFLIALNSLHLSAIIAEAVEAYVEGHVVHRTVSGRKITSFVHLHDIHRCNRWSVLRCLWEPEIGNRRPATSRHEKVLPAIWKLDRLC